MLTSSPFTWACIPRDASGEVANPFSIAPDWVIDILSPGQSQTKVVRNILHCLTHGTQMGWLIDPEEKPVPNFASALQLTVGQIFSWLED
ncbi:MAG: Uma2 family endonuclease [Synechococcales cyanobacterium RU_4_20]|nr:Uma2 family endonuclease [Synechococcales cyanobacterium RU_4_20]NJR68900.1 Uma2 family endonuclease [Synechococcales cyanobacterium CRU_2_2]